MSVFISYSSKDHEFVEKLSISLVQKRINIWLDKWEMQPGDSLIDKIQAGITNSSFLLVVLTNNSVQSEWCKKELNSGLMRELEKKEVVVIPVLKEDCEIPLLLKEKVYADFRTDFEDGMNSLIKPLQHLISEHMGRMKKDDFITDFAINWGFDKTTSNFYLEIDSVTWYEKDKKTVLLQIRIDGDKNATERFKNQIAAGIPSLMKDTLMRELLTNKDFRDLNILVQSDKIDPYLFTIMDKKIPLSFNVIIKGVLMGVDTGNDLVINLIDFIGMINKLTNKDK